jgi:hypothetical protein
MNSTTQTDETSLLNDIQEYRQNFDSIYVGGIPKLFNQENAFLGFVSILTALDSLSGLYLPNQKTGERFRLFVLNFFPKDYKPLADELWQFRNSMIHSFNPGPFAITCHVTRNHLMPIQTNVGDITVLNIEDFYSTLLYASRKYFQALCIDKELQSNFRKRISAKDGGAHQAFTITEGKH